MDPIRFARRERIRAAELEALFAVSWGSPKQGYSRVFDHSFTWVSASSGDQLIGFVNVTWDGDVHFFLLDLTVHPDWRRKGIGIRLVEEAIDACRGRGDWLHVDASDELMVRLYERCGFQPSKAGLINLRVSRPP